MIKSIRKGFTLMELLIVMAIGAMLLAILYPLFGKAHQNALQSQAQTHMSR